MLNVVSDGVTINTRGAQNFATTHLLAIYIYLKEKKKRGPVLIVDSEKDDQSIFESIIVQLK